MWIVRATLNRLGVWDGLNRVRTLLKHHLRKAHEPDFEFFNTLEGKEGLFLDVGANSGQSALSLSLYNSTLSILSLEPNPLLKRDLEFTQQILGSRFHFELVGASNKTAECDLFIPYVDRTPLYQEATFNESILKEDRTTRDRIKAFTGKPPELIKKVAVRFVRLDERNLAPLVIKIDVQGAEELVLAGLQSTLSKYHPILLIENGDHLKNVAAYLQPFGYSPMAFDAKTKRLTTLSEASPLNVFFVFSA